MLPRIFSALFGKLKDNSVDIFALVLVILLTVLGTFYICTVQYDFAAKILFPLASVSVSSPLRKVKFGGFSEFFYSGFRVEILFACLPWKTNDYTVAFAVAVDLTVVDIE